MLSFIQPYSCLVCVFLLVLSSHLEHPARSGLYRHNSGDNIPEILWELQETPKYTPTHGYEQNRTVVCKFLPCTKLRATRQRHMNL